MTLLHCKFFFICQHIHRSVGLSADSAVCLDEDVLDQLEQFVDEDDKGVDDLAQLVCLVPAEVSA